jgi:O-antigen/teichoic acid export membrane protein
MTDERTDDHGPEPDGDASSLGRTALQGARWVALSRLGSEILGFASSIVLARLILPAEFGHAIIALFVGALALGVSQQNVGAALVQMAAPRQRHYEAAMAMALGLGVSFAILTWLVTVALRGQADDATLDLVALMSLAFVVVAPSAVPQALLQRRLDFRLLSLVEVLAVVANVAVSVGCALAGLEGESIVLGFLAQFATSTLLFTVLARFVGPRVHRAEMREIGRFGLPASTGSLLSVASSNVDYVILGARLSALDVGLYWRSYQLGVEYQGKVSGILLRVAFPLFSRASDLATVRELRRRIVRLHTVLLFPPLGLLIVTGPTVVPWLYGPEWAPAGELVRWLAIAGLAQVVGSGTGPLMLATGHPVALRNMTLFTLVCLAAAVWFSSAGGVEAVAITVAGFRVTTLLLGQYVLVERLLGIRLLDTLRDDVLPAGICTAVGMVPAALALRAGESLDLPTIGTLAFSAAAGLAGYALALRAAFPDAAGDVGRLAGRFLPSRRAPAPTG